MRAKEKGVLANTPQHIQPRTLIQELPRNDIKNS